jgi:hypothetical protein
MKKFVLLIAVVLSFYLDTFSQAAQKTSAVPEILILGTYHMANPGRDVFNMEADDVTLPKRQLEIAQLIAVLKQFRPTKIAIESDVWSKRRTQEYSDYVAGKFTLTRNEIDQIGYRLAKEMGHSTIYPGDVDGDFPIGRVRNYAKANGRADKLESTMAGWGVIVKEQDAFLRTHTVLQTLEYMNADAKATRDMGLYFTFVGYGDANDYAGADLLASWYQRNIRIYQNIVRLIDSPDERILVIYGAGHLGWLRQIVANDPSVGLRKLSEFAGK